MKMKMVFLSLLLHYVVSKHMNIGTFSDIHLDLRYNPTSSERNCMDPVGASEAQNSLLNLKKLEIALLGRLGCDPPKELLDYMLKLFNQVNSDKHIDVITLNGDLIGHHIAQNYGTSDQVIAPYYDLLLETHAVV